MYLFYFSRSDSHATDTSTLCNEHFTADDYENWTAYRFNFATVHVLKDDAVPSRRVGDFCDQVIEITFAPVHTKVHCSQCYKASKFIGLLLSSVLLFYTVVSTVVLASLASL